MFIKHIVRTCFVIFWACIIYAFLLLPYLEPVFFKEQEYLCVYSWADRIDESVLIDFEKKTGIKVYLNHYESNEELLTKLENMPYVDCDLILPSGYIINSMVQAGLLKKIDYSQCSFMQEIYPDFLTSFESVRNEYGIPLYWDVLGIGYDNTKVNEDSISLDLIFNKDSVVGKKIGMIDDARQSIVLASLYLQQPLDSLTEDHLKSMHELLNSQKRWVGSYNDSQQGYFLSSKTFSVVASEREYVCKQMLKYDFISFALPQEGSLLTTEYAVMSASTKKEALVYKLINYLFSDEILKQNCELFCLLPTKKTVFEQLDQKYMGVQDLSPGSKKFKELKIFKNVLTHKQINDFWVRLKSR